MTTALITHSAFANHDTGPFHPERSERMRVIDKALEHEVYKDLVRHEAPLRADDADYIVMAHSKAHLTQMRSVADGFTGEITHIDGDTVVSSGTWDAVRRAIGAGLDAVDMVMARDASNVFCQVRPPGHHAESQKAMGFCLFNNIAIAAHYARAKHGAERVAVVDFDVHHGNGTQEIFYSNKNLFYGSTHQMPLFPGTGALTETGVGNIFNAPMREGDGRVKFEQAFDERILGPLRNFAPDIVFISAGFDAHRDDPLGGMQLVEADFAWATERLAEIARRHANGRVVSMLEGGYNLTALARSVAVHVKTLMETGGR
jgi:acetoin utilization deacetylase AcuC-like enzyme